MAKQQVQNEPVFWPNEPVFSCEASHFRGEKGNKARGENPESGGGWQKAEVRAQEPGVGAE
jgi:hypothetical protein